MPLGLIRYNAATHRRCQECACDAWHAPNATNGRPGCAGPTLANDCCSWRSKAIAAGAVRMPCGLPTPWPCRKAKSSNQAMARANSVIRNFSRPNALSWSSTLWHHAPVLHVPKDEDFGVNGTQNYDGVAITAWAGCDLKPRNFFSSTHSTLELANLTLREVNRRALIVSE